MYRRDFGRFSRQVNNYIYYFFNSQIFYEVLDIFPPLLYQLTFIMLNVGMVDNQELWQIRSKTHTFSTHGFLTKRCYYFFSQQYEPLPFFFSRPKQLYQSYGYIHVQHLASLCLICGDEIEDHKRKADTNCFVSEIHQIWKEFDCCWILQMFIHS